MAGNAIGKVRVDLVANTRAFASGMKRAGASVARFTKVAAVARAAVAAMKVAFMAVAGAITAAGYAIMRNVKKQLEVYDDIGKTADRLGVSAKALQKFQLSAKLAGVETNVFNKALQMMVKNVGMAAATGTGEAAKILERLKLDPKALRAMGPEQAFYAIANAMQTVETQTEKLEMAFALFGGRGTGVLNMIAQGAAGIDDAAKGFNFVDDAQIDKMEMFNDSVTRLSASWDLFGATIAARVAPALLLITNSMQRMIDDVEEWAHKLTSIIKTISRLPLMDKFMKLYNKNLGREMNRRQPGIPEGFAGPSPKSAKAFFGAPEAVQQGTTAAYSAERVGRIQNSAMKNREEQRHTETIDELKDQTALLRDLQNDGDGSDETLNLLSPNLATV